MAIARTGKTGAALEFQGQAEELELAGPDQFLEVHQPFEMGDAEIAAQPVLGEEVDGPSTLCMREPLS